MNVTGISTKARKSLNILRVHNKISSQISYERWTLKKTISNSKRRQYPYPRILEQKIFHARNIPNPMNGNNPTRENIQQEL